MLLLYFINVPWNYAYYFGLSITFAIKTGISIIYIYVYIYSQLIFLGTDLIVHLPTVLIVALVLIWNMSLSIAALMQSLADTQFSLEFCSTWCFFLCIFLLTMLMDILIFVRMSCWNHFSHMASTFYMLRFLSCGSRSK